MCERPDGSSVLRAGADRQPLESSDRAQRSS